MKRIGILATLALAVSCSSGEEAPAPIVLGGDSTLSALTVSAGALSPDFTSSTHDYSLVVPYGTGVVRVTPTAADTKALSVGVRQDNLALYATGSGHASSALSVPTVGAAASKITVRVVAQDGSSSDYTIALTQSAKLSSDASLASLTVSAGTLTPAFDPTLYDYVVSVPNGTASLSVTATKHDASARAVAIRQDAGEFGAAAIDIPAVGASSTITVRVTAQDGTVADYAVTLTQAPAVAPASFTIYAVGDSTMADYDPAVYPDQAGWGQMFRNFLVGTQAAYVNAARNGRSSKSFYDEGTWATAVRSKLKSGDYVLIQFAHNDEKTDGTDDAAGIGTAPFGTFQTYLGKYVDETRAAGATPILVTPIVRRYFDANGAITPKGAHDLTGVGDPSLPVSQDLNYVEAMKQVATAKSVPVIDLTASTKALVEQYGPTQAKSVIYIAADDTHIQPLGATMFAQLAVQALVAQNILAAYLNPAADLIVSPTSLDFGQIYAGNTATKAVSITGLSVSPAAGNVTVSAPAGYAVSATQAGTYAPTLDVPYTGGKLAPTTVWVKFTPTAAQVYPGSVTVTPPTGNAKSVAVTGTGLAATTGGTESTATYAMTTDDNCTTTGLATCLQETYSGVYAKGFTTVNSTNTAVTWIPSVPANDHVEKVSILGDTWPGSEIDIVPSRYVQFAVAPAAGKSWAIDAISLWTGGAGGSNLGFRILYSKSADFSNPQVLLDSGANAKDTMTFQSLQPVVTVNSGETLYIRAFPWLRSSPASGKYLCMQSLVVHGSIQ